MAPCPRPEHTPLPCTSPHLMPCPLAVLWVPFCLQPRCPRATGAVRCGRKYHFTVTRQRALLLPDPEETPLDQQKRVAEQMWLWICPAPPLLLRLPHPRPALEWGGGGQQRLLVMPRPHRPNSNCCCHKCATAASCPTGALGREGASETAPEAVRQAVGGGCRSGWGRLLSVTNAI